MEESYQHANQAYKISHKLMIDNSACYRASELYNSSCYRASELYNSACYRASELYNSACYRVSELYNFVVGNFQIYRRLKMPN